jgi:hypothetical protein
MNVKVFLISLAISLIFGIPLLLKFRDSLGGERLCKKAKAAGRAVIARRVKTDIKYNWFKDSEYRGYSDGAYNDSMQSGFHVYEYEVAGKKYHYKKMVMDTYLEPPDEIELYYKAGQPGKAFRAVDISGGCGRRLLVVLFLLIPFAIYFLIDHFFHVSNWS